MVSHAPWLLEAPLPWGPTPASPSADATVTTNSATRKRQAEDLMSEAEVELSKLATATGRRIDTNGWRRTIVQARGPSNIARAVRGIPHRSARLLEHLRVRGASVSTRTAPWDAQRRDAATERGPHKSSHGERQFVCEEMLDFCQQGYWIVVPYATVSDWPNLRISPLGVVPQRDRRPRLIVDYTYSGVNGETISLAPREAMQFGRAFQRLLSHIVHANPRYGPVHMAKIDIADGFYRVWIQVDDVPKLGVVLPIAPGHTPLVAFPLALPMGWVESPPYFTILTETACDLANHMLKGTEAPRLQTHHRLETVAATPLQRWRPSPGGLQTRVVRRGADLSHLDVPQWPPWTSISTIFSSWRKRHINSGALCVPPYIPSTTSSGPSRRATLSTVRSPRRSRKCLKAMPVGRRTNGY